MLISAVRPFIQHILVELLLDARYFLGARYFLCAGVIMVSKINTRLVP